MNLNKLILATAALCLTASIQAEPRRTGNTLIAACGPTIEAMDTVGSLPNTFDAGYCVGSVSAVMDASYSTSESAYRSCFPKGMTAGQGVRVVMKYLQNNPEELHQSDTTLVFAAFKNTFPCKGL